MTERISDAEHAVMEVLWEESPLSAQDVAERVAPDRGWSANTVKTLKIPPTMAPRMPNTVPTDEAA